MFLISDLLLKESMAQAILVLSLVVTLGLTIGEIKLLRVRLGVAGVLFAGILFGHFGVHPNFEILEFVREFGLILFVYTIGMQVGPGFLSSFKKEGLKLNSLAVIVVLSGVLVTLAIIVFAKVPVAVAVGLFSGGTTNTPSLAAAQQAFKEIPGLPAETLKMPGIGYALAYPFGIMGIILTMVLTKTVFKLTPKTEAELYHKHHHTHTPPLEVMNLRVDNGNLAGQKIKTLTDMKLSAVTISRILHGDDVQVALPESALAVGDVILAVGPAAELDKLRMLVGSKAPVDLRKIKSDVSSKRVIVTKRAVTGRTLEELDIFNRYGITITRVMRLETEFAASDDFELHLGDVLVVVGEADSIKKFVSDVGDSPKSLDKPHVVPIFVGLALGVFLGSIPIYFKGLPSPLKLGMAGGPLLVAILLSSRRKIGRIIWYMPAGANLMLRELGISLFLAAVGLKAGDQFVRTLTNGPGLTWMALAALITVLPILFVAFYARLRYKMNYLTLCGLLAGSMTDPPALAFANQMTPSNAQIMAYSQVYPLVMILRIFSAQILVILLGAAN